MVVRFACSGSESPVLAAGVQLGVVVAVAVAAVVVGAGVEVLAQVAAAESTESADVVVEAG